MSAGPPTQKVTILKDEMLAKMSAVRGQGKRIPHLHRCHFGIHGTSARHLELSGRLLCPVVLGDVVVIEGPARGDYQVGEQLSVQHMKCSWEARLGARDNEAVGCALGRSLAQQGCIHRQP